MGRIRRVGSVKQELLQKSKEAALSAVQIFNNPNISYLSIMRQNVVNLAKMLKVDQTILKNLEEGE